MQVPCIVDTFRPEIEVLLPTPVAKQGLKYMDNLAELCGDDAARQC